MIKRILDIMMSALGLVILSPILFVLAAWIKMDSPGPVFYRGVRAGRHGRPFRIYKFRSMVINADRIGGPSTPADDPRVTKPGRFIRRYKLDELPQLVNVLKGDMSFVGPRPEVMQYVALYSVDEQNILSVRPGITDWASIANPDEGALLAGAADPEKTYLEQIRPQKIRLQLKYVKNQSLLGDLKILLETFYVLLLGRRALYNVGSIRGES